MILALKSTIFEQFDLFLSKNEHSREKSIFLKIELQNPMLQRINKLLNKYLELEEQSLSPGDLHFKKEVIS